MEMEMTLKRAENILIGNPLRDIATASLAVAKMNKSKNAPAWLRRISQRVEEDIYLETSSTPQEWNHRMLEIAQ